MKIEKNRIATFHYRLSEGKQELENSYPSEPMAYLHGQGNIVSGLEEEMLGKSAGDHFTVTVPPEKAYGLKRDNAQQRVPIKHLQSKGKLKPGQAVNIQTEHGIRQATILKVGKFNVDVDTNHPFAGKTLDFDIEVLEVRDASAEEIAHGHAHGVGGHQH